jgi:hypothetical protein
VGEQGLLVREVAGALAEGGACGGAVLADGRQMPDPGSAGPGTDLGVQ